MNTSKQVNVMVILIFFLLLALGGYTLWDPLRADEAEEEQADKTAERGAFLFAQNCRVCHGDAGEGGALGGRLPQAPPLDRPDLQGRTSADEPVDDALLKQAVDLIENTVRCGRVGTAMPVWGESQGGPLNEEQIRQLAAMITTGAWDKAVEFADEADDTGFHLVAPDGLSAEETVLTLSDVEGFVPDAVIRIDDERMTIDEVRQDDNQVVVERGVRATQAEEHADGAEVFRQPEPSEPPAITTESCGQFARGVSTPAEASPTAATGETPEATPEETPEATPEATSEATPEATTVTEFPGEDVFLGAAGCSACHTIDDISSGAVGPELTHVATNAGTRIEGLSAEEYIRESIEDPGAFIVPGFPNAMPPGIRSLLSDEEFEQLVEYLLSLK